MNRLEPDRDLEPPGELRARSRASAAPIVFACDSTVTPANGAASFGDRRRRPPAGTAR